MNVNYLPDAEQHPLWPQIRQLLQPSAEYGEVAVEHDNQVVWIAHENGTVFAAATTLLWEDGDAELRLAGGTRHRDWIHKLDGVVSAWARDAGAKKITMRGRKGWARYATRCGWATLAPSEQGMIYEKDL